MWAVDTCVIIDVADADPEFGTKSAKCLESHLGKGLCISPVTYVELSPLFLGNRRELDRFLEFAGLSVAEWTVEDSHAAFQAWSDHIERRKISAGKKRPIADIFIGALALRCEGIITRNSDDFKSLFPQISTLDPAHPRHG